MKHYFLYISFFFPLLLNAQLYQQQVAVCDVQMTSIISNTEFNVTLSNFQDAQNTGLSASTLLADTFRLVDNNTQGIYQVKEIFSTGKTTAYVRIKEIDSTDALGLPGGRSVIYNYDEECDFIFLAPQNSQGLPNTLLARIQNHNLIAIKICIVVDTAATVDLSVDLQGIRDSLTIAYQDTSSFNEIEIIQQGFGIGVNVVGKEHTIVNTDPDQVVELKEGSNVIIEGTYPIFTVSATEASNVVDNIADGSATLTTSVPQDATIFAVKVNGTTVKQGVDWTANGNVINWIRSTNPPVASQIEVWYKL